MTKLLSFFDFASNIREKQNTQSQIVPMVGLAYRTVLFSSQLTGKGVSGNQSIKRKFVIPFFSSIGAGD